MLNIKNLFKTDTDTESSSDEEEVKNADGSARSGRARANTFKDFFTSVSPKVENETKTNNEKNETTENGKVNTMANDTNTNDNETNSENKDNDKNGNESAKFEEMLEEAEATHTQNLLIVGDFLETIGMLKYLKIFDNNGFDSLQKIASDMTQIDLINMNVSVNDQKILLDAIQALNDPKKMDNSSNLASVVIDNDMKIQENQSQNKINGNKNKHKKHSKKQKKEEKDENDNSLQSLTNTNESHLMENSNLQNNESKMSFEYGNREEEYYLTQIRKYPKNGYWHALYCIFLHRNGRNSRAKIHGNYSLDVCKFNAKNGKNKNIVIELLYCLGYIHYCDGLSNYFKARNYLQQCIELNTNDAKAHYLLGCLEKDVGNQISYCRRRAAALGVNSVIEDDMRNIFPRALLVILNQDRLYESVSWYHSSRAHFENVIKIYPKSFIDAYYHLSLIYIQLLKYEEAINLLKKAINFDPFYKYARLELCKIYLYKTRDYPQAEAMLTESIELDKEFGDNKDWESRLLYGELLHYQYKRYNDAEDEYLSVIDINPKNALAYYHLAFLQRDCLENIENGQKYFEIARKLDPKHPSMTKYLQSQPVTATTQSSSIYDKVSQTVRKFSTVATNYTTNYSSFANRNSK